MIGKLAWFRAQSTGCCRPVTRTGHGRDAPASRTALRAGRTSARTL
ncbi:hypothetical protein SLNWT_0221 [Streptomyces albus]|uniref:Uncharacterized protein n=1 Tax=Streptomyces albus (strain ATCC 21838 / DSM 41398 / FERM P-419 / JCM 4703 / NBRC 107858) TaxID=1081613 RepID=A0A0B5ER20_STRA4|nr:hypothetical protein SLNWT_0221 [Streptomyces albus]